MICLTNIYEEIIVDFSKEEYKDTNVLYRKLTLVGGIVLLFSVYRGSEIAEISFSLPENSLDSIKKLPKWKGMEEKIISSIEPNTKDNMPFLSFIQSKDYDKKIYFTVLQDLANNLNKVDILKVPTIAKEVLEKWKVFFRFEENYVLSDNVQQGLYGELYILENILSRYGDKAIDCWTGCNAETQDFYFGRDALEVKSSSSKSNNRIKISNEYQLDDSKIMGNLYLMYLKMNKSEIMGERLPDIVKRISEKLSDLKKKCFYDKLLKVGYVHEIPELYKVYFSIQDESCYKVTNQFPKITRKNIPKEISSVEYVISLEPCERFLITIEDYYKEVNL